MPAVYELNEAEISLLAKLMGEQGITGRPVPLLDLAVEHFGSETDARQVLRRLLVHGLIQLTRPAEANEHFYGTVIGTPIERTLPARPDLSND